MAGGEDGEMRLEVDFLGWNQVLVEEGRTVRENYILRNDPWCSARATQWIKCRFLMWDTTLPFCNVHFKFH